MTNKSDKQSEFLIDSKAKVSPEVLSIVANLINNGREDLSHIVLKIDYLLQYANACIKQQEMSEAKEAVNKARIRLEMIKRSSVDTGFLDNTLENVERKIEV